MGKAKEKKARPTMEIVVNNDNAEVAEEQGTPRGAPVKMTPEERRIEWAILTRLFYAGEPGNRLEPRTREQGEQWLEDLGNQMEKIMDDAQAIHLQKIAESERAKEPDPRVEAARQRLKALEARGGRRKK